MILAAETATDLHWVWVVLGLLSIPALVAVNGYFVAAEFALVAIRRTRVEELLNQGVRGARAVDEAVRHLDRSIAASQLGITLASLGLGYVCEPAMVQVIAPAFGFLPDHWAVPTAHTVAFIITIILITFLHVVLGEQYPKTVALQTPDTMSLWVAKPLNAFGRVTRPLIRFMNWVGNLLLRASGYRPAGAEATIHSVEELKLLIEDTEEAGILDSDAAEYVQNVFELSNKCVSECMVPRHKIAALELTTPPEKVLDAVRAGAHTRMPVYDGTLDNMVGIVNTKDLFYLFSLQGVVVLEDALYPATYLDPSESVANALRLFQKSRKPMALVREENGRIVGLMTLEDAIEEIVGDIEDEHDRPLRKLRYVRRRKPETRIKETGRQGDR